MKIHRQVYRQIIEEAKAESPLECCGYLAGPCREVIVRAYPMENMDKSSVHFSFNPAEQLKIIKEMRNDKLKAIGVYHSHPETPARPSQEDIRLAYDPAVSYVIISLCEEEIEVRSFRIKRGQVEEEEIAIL